MKLSYSSVHVGLVFPVVFRFVPHLVKYMSEIKLEFHVLVLGSLSLAWHGKGGEMKETMHEDFKHSSDGLVKSFMYCDLAASPLTSFSFNCSQYACCPAVAWGLECVFCRNSSVISERWTSFSHFRWWFPCL